MIECVGDAVAIVVGVGTAVGVFKAIVILGIVGALVDIIAITRTAMRYHPRVRGKIVFVLAAASACLFPSIDDLAQADAGASDSASPIDAADASVDAADAADAQHDAKQDSSELPGPITFVQVNAQEFNAGGTALVSLASVKPHNTLIVCAGIDGQGALTASDAQGDAYTQYVQYDSTADGFQSNTVWAAFDVAGGDTTVKVTTQVDHSDFEVYVIEYGGLTAFDVTMSSQGNSTAIDAMASGFATTTFGNDLIFGYGTEGIGVVGTGFTLLSGFEQDVVEARVVSTIGSYQATATMQSGGGWEMTMVAFKGF